MNWKIKNRNLTFFALQFLGWGAFFLLVFLSLTVKGGFFSKLFLFFSLTLVGIIPTTLLRFYLKITKSTNRFSVLNGIKIASGVAVASWIFITIPYYLGYASSWLIKRIAPNESLDVTNSFQYDAEGIRYFSALILVTAWTFAYLGVQYFLRLNTRRAERIQIKDSIKKAQLNTLRGHLNPNFIIYVLGAIRAIMDTDVKLARRMLTELSEILRYSLTKNDVHHVFIHEELQMVDNYALLLNKITTSDIAFKKEFSKPTLALEIPSMLLLNLCELVAENDDFREDGTTEFGLKGNVEDSVLVLTLSCPKFSSAQPDHLIEARIQQRLKLLYQNEADYHKSYKQGLVVQIRLPHQKESDFVENL